MNHEQDCPCESGKAYGRCCSPLHEGAASAAAEALMRSRYSAYVLGLEPYLLATWHSSTRPAQVEFDPKTRWLGLTVKSAAESGDTAVVEFVARYKLGGGSAVRMHEKSRFLREDGRWYYVDGEFRDK